jgi:hypothetical protein
MPWSVVHLWWEESPCEVKQIGASVPTVLQTYEAAELPKYCNINTNVYINKNYEKQ